MGSEPAAALPEALPEAVVAVLDGLFGRPAAGLALHEPWLKGREGEAVAAALAAGWVSSAGPEVARFEALLAEACGVPHAVAVSSGTAALQVALLLAGVEPGDEVLLPALTFVGTANAVVHAGAVPHFCDSEAATLGLCPAALEARLARIAEPAGGGLRNRESGRRIAALLPVHVFGHPAELEGLLAVAARHGVALVEDAAEALGSRRRGRPAGSFGRLAALSFNGNKIVTTGGGGALLTADPELARAARHLTSTAKLAHPWRFDHDRVAFNYRLPNLNAALGVAQLERLPAFLAAKRRLARRYEAAFAGVAGVSLQPEPPGCESNFWLNALLLDDPDPGLRDRVLQAANAAGYRLRPAWTLLHRLPMYAAAPRAPLPVAEALEARIVNLPSSAGLELDRPGG